MPALPSRLFFPLKATEASLSIADFEGTLTLLPADGQGMLIEEMGGRPLSALKIHQSGQHVYLKPAAEKKPASRKASKAATPEVAEPDGTAETPVPAPPTPVAVPASALNLQIYLPIGSRLKLENIRRLNAKLALGDVRIEASACQQLTLLEVTKLNLRLSGRCQTLFGRVTSADLDLAGATQVQINQLTGGDFSARGKDSSVATARGEFSEIDLKTEDSARVVTSGSVSGKFKALALNSSLIGHNGPIQGKVLRKLSDTAQINLSPRIR